MEKDIITRIDEYFHVNEMSQKDFAEIINMPETTFSNWLKKEQAISIYSLAKITATISPLNHDVQEQDIIHHLQKHTRESINLKIAFLLAHLNGYTAVIDYIIDVCKNKTEMELQKCANIFQLYRDRLSGAEKLCDIFVKIEKVSPFDNKKHYHIALFCDILSMLILTDLGKFDLIQPYQKRVQTNLSRVKVKNIKQLYNFWIDSILGYGLLRKDDIFSFKEIYVGLGEFQDLSLFPVMKCILDSRWGESQLIDNPKYAIRELENSCERLLIMGETTKYQTVLNTLNFLRVVMWIDIRKIRVEDLHPAEYALYLIFLGELDMANQVLDRLELKNGGLSPIQGVYRGMAKQNGSIIEGYIDLMKSKNDFYYVRVIKKVLDIYQKHNGMEFVNN
ncbi:AimR family lysis-lysogeny pheromone receptor [Bacillus cereus]|uniref:Transcriptional regulator n=1 Tax=Bacillus cereus TaxID=1396 RepID=A0A9X7M0V4_BACCE|nr:AimR family lysis-lysogeny pheromone receptor [Bacillus cereus]MDA2637884.1 AimR family lysis-lysogeny pheromone receptor [Bacillus cereus]QDZ76626.1 hypothetical protein D0437_27685 [Bacillus cereus]